MMTNTALAAGGLAASSLIAQGAFALPSVAPRRVFGGKLAKLNVLQIGVGGSIAPADRHELTQHPDVNFAGLCDVDSDALKEVSAKHPAAFTCSDFREAFDKAVRAFTNNVRIERCHFYDTVIQFDQITFPLYESLQPLEPHGPENLRPVFLSKNIKNARFTKLAGCVK